MIQDNVPVCADFPHHKIIEIYFLHDIHYGNEMFNESKYQAAKKEILAADNRYCIFVGDMMENAVPNSKSDVFSQTVNPELQKEWLSWELHELSDKVIAVIPGNHESNRSTKLCGLHPAYDACVYAGMQNRYRQNFAVVDIGIGDTHKERHKPVPLRYVGYIVHKAKDAVNYSTVDSLEGFDFMAFGHDHQPKDKPRAHLVYDSSSKSLYKRNIETINCGSFLNYGGYAAVNSYRPNSDKMYKLIIGNETNARIKTLQTVGFYL